MTTKLILINTDTHVVVPREPTQEILDAPYGGITKWNYHAILEASPQLTTPPVLRWEGDYLKVGNIPIAIADEFRGDFAWSCQREEGSAKSLEEARRAAEKALGLPIVEEV